MVVETVEFQPFEGGSFPPPTTPQEVGARVLLQDRFLQGQEQENKTQEEPFTAQDDTEVQDMEEDSESSDSDDDDDGPEKQTMQPPKLPVPEPPRQDRVIIKKDYDPKQSKEPIREAIKPSGPEEYTISPITGERIPVSKLQEHVRIGLLDPRWRDQREKQMLQKTSDESVFAPGIK